MTDQVQTTPQAMDNPAPSVASRAFENVSRLLFGDAKGTSGAGDGHSPFAQHEGQPGASQAEVQKGNLPEFAITQPGLSAGDIKPQDPSQHERNQSLDMYSRSEPSSAPSAADVLGWRPQSNSANEYQSTGGAHSSVNEHMSDAHSNAPQTPPPENQP